MNKNIIYEFDFDIALSKLGFKNKESFSIHEVKLFLLYTLGKKFKKREIINQIKNIRRENENLFFIKKEELKLLQEINQINLSEKDYLESLFKYITNNDIYIKEISLDLFRNKINEILPNLSKGILNQVFYYLSNNSNTISIEKALKNSSLKNK